MHWKRDAESGAYFAAGDDGKFYSISNEQGGWIVYVRDAPPDLTAYPMKLGRQHSGFIYPTLREAKAATP